jgi:cytochrome c553
MRHAGTIAAAVAALIAGTLSAVAEPPEKLVACLACHGAGGQSVTEKVPSLGAQPSPYSVIQLFLFREKMRVVEPMTEMAKELSDADLQTLADALAALPAPKPPADPGDPARLERTRALVEQNHCNVCHRADFSGQANVPRLADQREDYLLKALRDYKSGARQGYDPVMVEVVQSLGDSQLVELAYYVSHLR